MLPVFLFCRFCIMVLFLFAVAAHAQQSVPAVMLSDIHFDPFHDPHLLAQLRAEPMERWPAILSAPASLAADADRAELEIKCHSHSLDTAWPLLATTLKAAHEAEPHPVFVTLSGDLLTHEFPCRFRTLTPNATPAQLAAFAAKTVSFVAWQLRLAFPRVPVFTALGNNDSGCADYAQTPESPFRMSTQESIMAGIEQARAGRARWKPWVETSPVGDYSVALPPPLEHGRLIVLDDVYDSELYRTCSATVDAQPEAEQIAWLRAQLQQARESHEQVWVMGHIPTGVDVYASFVHYVLRPGEVCSAQPHGFLTDTKLADTLVDFADVIRLVVFAHTHMDEIRLLHRATGASEGGTKAQSETIPAEAIPVKLVPSVTPYFGNHPAFLVAEIDPRTLVLRDWQTMVSPGPNGSAPPWSAAYRFTTAYGLPDFSAKSAEDLADGFAADRKGKDARSHTYRDHFYPGGFGLYALGLEEVWPAYACAVRESSLDGFHDCLCPASAPAEAPGQEPPKASTEAPRPR